MKNLNINVKKLLLNIKHNLPLNGDFLFVTETPINPEVFSKELVVEYHDPKDVLKDLNSKNEDVVKLIYERALKYNRDVEFISENLKKKGEILLRMTSFVSAIFLGILSFISTNISKNINTWILLIICIFFVFMGIHLISSLIRSIKVMTREESILSSPQQIVFKNNETITNEKLGSILNAYKIATADIVSNTCMTHSLINKNINMIIIAQNSFVYGLLFFMLIVGLQLSALLFLKSDKIDELSISNIVQIEDKLLENIEKRRSLLLEQIEKRKQIIEILRIKNKEVLEQFIQINEVLLQINKNNDENSTKNLMEIKKE